MGEARKYRIAAIFDTETSTIGAGALSRAFVYAYVFNDLRLTRVSRYEFKKSDNVKILRYEDQALSFIDSLVEWGDACNVTPIVCAYNLAFDLHSLIYKIGRKYHLETLAQSANSIYVVDAYNDEGSKVLRFWDVSFLEPNGLGAMGDLAGVPKLIGALDYSKVRHCETPLTEQDKAYMIRDVQVIPAFLNYILKTNEFITEHDLGVSVMTRTSIVRQYAKRVLAPLSYRRKNGKLYTIGRAFTDVCNREKANSYDQYLLRKACFRGGLSFTSARFVHRSLRNVCSFDENSAYHAFIAGRFVPQFFKKDDEKGSIIETACRMIANSSIKEDPHKPFNVAFHACIEFEELRLKHGSAFDKFEFGTLAQARFSDKFDVGQMKDLRNGEAEAAMFAQGFHDSAELPKFAYGKLLGAARCSLFLNEIEFYTLSKVYEWDSMRVEFGEYTMKFQRPPDYVVLQSMAFYSLKNQVKRIRSGYKEGVPYSGAIGESVPNTIAEGLRSGAMGEQALCNYYVNTVKAQFNSIFGSQVMDEMRPSFLVTEEGELTIDKGDLPTREGFEPLKVSKVHYCYGMRIAAWARAQLVEAISDVYSALGDRARILSGDTDSFKVQLDGIEANDVLVALEPLHRSTREAIAHSTERVASCFPQLFDPLEHVGEFVCEGSSLEHVELWNKARVDLLDGGKVKATIAGIAQPDKAADGSECANVSRAIESMMASEFNPLTFQDACSLAFHYNSYINHSISYSLAKVIPLAKARYIGEVTDYLGNVAKIDQHEAIAIYECGLMLGATNKADNIANISYQDMQGRIVPEGLTELCYDGSIGYYVTDFLADEMIWPDQTVFL